MLSRSRLAVSRRILTALKDGFLQAKPMADYRLLTDSEQNSGDAVPHRKREYGMLTDGQLVMLSLNRGNRAFVTLSNRYDRDIRRLVVRRIANINDVDDVVQSVWIKAWRALASYDVGRPFLNWLSVIATNQCRDHHRRSASYAAMLASSTDEATNIGLWALAADDIVASRHALSELRGQMQQLPRPLHDALVQSVEWQNSHAEIAGRLDVSTKAIEMRVRKARQHLRAALPHLI